MDQITRIICCRAKDCKNESFKNPEYQYISFPNTREKFQLWAALCGRHDLMNVPESTFQNHHLCSIHFEKDQYESDQTISINAVPTIFSSESDVFEDEDTASVVNEVPDFDPDQPSSSHYVIAQNNFPTTTQTIRVVPPNILRGVTTQRANKTPVQHKRVPLPEPVVKRLQGTAPKAYLATKPKTIRLNTATMQSAEAGDVIHKDGKKYIILRKKVDDKKLTNSNIQGATSTTNVNSKTTNKANSAVNMQTKRPSPLTPQIDTSVIDLPSTHPLHIQHVVKKPRSDKPIGNIITLPKRPLPGTTPQVLPLINVAPSLPIPSKREMIVEDCYSCLRPKPWQDWPVSEGLFLSAAKQLLANYQKIFPRRERMDIETTLHLASHFNILDPLSKSHCRARVHHFLKILEIELEKAKKAEENAEKAKKPTTKAKRKTAHTNILIDDNSSMPEVIEDSSNKNKDSSENVIENSEELSFLSNENMDIVIEEVDNLVTDFLDVK